MSAAIPGQSVLPPAVAFRLAGDARLARMAAAGSEVAMTAIFERHHQELHRYCHSILGNGHDAADALQNTMVKMLGSSGAKSSGAGKAKPAGSSGAKPSDSGGPASAPGRKPLGAGSPAGPGKPSGAGKPDGNAGRP